MLDRRKFIAISACAVAAAPRLQAQQAISKTVGYLSSRSAQSELELLVWFRQGLSETGWNIDRNLNFTGRWAEGRYSRLEMLASELVSNRVDVIATSGGPHPVRAARGATRDIPIVFTSGSDPVRDGLVTAFNRPGGNVTGLHVFTTSLGPKRLALLIELVPSARVVGFLVNPRSQVAQMQVREIQDAARALNVEIVILDASAPNEIDRAFATLGQRKARALLMSADLFFQVRRQQIVDLAERDKIAVMYEWPEFVRAGGLISYSTSRRDAFRQLGVYTGRVLHGAKPAELPVVQSTAFELVVNLKTARSLGIAVPNTMLASADEVIE